MTYGLHFLKKLGLKNIETTIALKKAFYKKLYMTLLVLLSVISSLEAINLMINKHGVISKMLLKKTMLFLQLQLLGQICSCLKKDNLLTIILQQFLGLKKVKIKKY